jgi:hypothetical protein
MLIEAALVSDPRAYSSKLEARFCVHVLDFEIPK